MLTPVSGTQPEAREDAGSGDRLPRQPFLVGCRNHGVSTIWFLRPASLPVPGPWDVAVLLREG